jgi:hypothetical protein
MLTKLASGCVTRNVCFKGSLTVFFSAKWDLSRQPRASSFPLDYVQTVTYIYSTPPLNEVQLRNLSTIFDTTTATATVSTSDLIPTGGLFLWPGFALDIATFASAMP